MWGHCRLPTYVVHHACSWSARRPKPAAATCRSSASSETIEASTWILYSLHSTFNIRLHCECNIEPNPTPSFALAYWEDNIHLIIWNELIRWIMYLHSFQVVYLFSNSFHELHLNISHIVRHSMATVANKYQLARHIIKIISVGQTVYVSGVSFRLMLH